VDGGATKTLCAIVNDDLNVLGVGMAGPSNYYVVGVEKARENIDLAINQALSKRTRQKNAIDIGCFGIAGFQGAEASEVISNFIKSLNVAREYIITDDVRIIYQLVAWNKPGVVVVAGTGSNAYGNDGRGSEAQVGGWGWVIGDEGSAFYIARQAIIRATKAFDGRASPTQLVELVKSHFSVENFEDTVTAIKKLQRPQQIASFAKHVSSAADKGDQVAKEVLIDAGKELSLLATTVANKLNITDQQVLISGTGGVWESKMIWEIFKDEVKKTMPRVTFREPIRFPVGGAVVLALRKKGIHVSEKKANEIEKVIAKQFDLISTP